MRRAGSLGEPDRHRSLLASGKSHCRASERGRNKCRYEGSGYDVRFGIREDTEALQRGAAVALFANLTGGWRLGADWARAPGRPAEVIGEWVASSLLGELTSGAVWTVLPRIRSLH